MWGFLWVTSIQICSLMLCQYWVEFERCLFNEDFLKSRQREEKRERTETMTAFTLWVSHGKSFVWFCCFCNGNAYLLSYLTICLPLVQKVLVIPHWVRGVANEVHRKTMQYKASERMSKLTCILTLIYPKCFNWFIRSQMYSWEHFKEHDSHHNVTVALIMHSNYRPWSNS